MKAKQIVIAATLITGLCAGVWAQNEEQPKPRPGGGERGAVMRERLREANKELNLTAEQQEQMRQLRQKTAEQAKQIRGNTELTQEEKREKAKAVQEEFRASVKKILTAEQWEKWEQLREKNAKQMRERPPGGRRQGGPPPPPADKE